MNPNDPSQAELLAASERYNSLLRTKRDAGLSQPLAAAAAFDQLVGEGMNGQFTAGAVNQVLIPIRFRTTVETKLGAGLAQDSAEKSAFDQLVLDGQNGTLDRDAVIQFLIALLVSQGLSQDGASQHVLPLFDRAKAISGEVLK
jgi:hypothetical protein